MRAPERRVAPQDWVPAARTAYEQGYRVLDLLAAVDERDRLDAPGLDVVAELLALPDGGPPQRRRLVTRVPEGVALDSLAGIWPGAAWQERAAADLSGLTVRHAGVVPERLLLPIGYAGPPPLAKSTVLAARASTAWPGAPEPGESTQDAAGEAGRQPAERRTQRRRQRPTGVPDHWPT